MGQGKTVTIVAALARNRAIGHAGGIPWHLPGELQHFKRTTMGRSIVMGRKTWESIGRPLPGRQNLVVTRNAGYQAHGCIVVFSLEQALERAESREVMVIGGGELYRQALPLARRMVLTLVECEPEADTWFPDWPEAEWREAAIRQVPADERNPVAYRIVELLRRNDAAGISPAPARSPRPPA